MTVNLHRAPDAAAAGDVWARLAAPLPPGVIEWRQDGRPVARDGKFFARFVAYISAGVVRQRLDEVVPGEWSFTTELLPTAPESSEEPTDTPAAFKGRLTILGVVREDVGVGKDYKVASTDSFKRAAVRYGIGHELYELEMNWVEMDGDGRYAKPREDPQKAYERRHGVVAQHAMRHEEEIEAARRAPAAGAAPAERPAKSEPPLPAAPPSTVGEVPPCPKCGGRMWDNRIGKRNPKAPDFKCRDRTCDGVIWPPKPAGGAKGKGSAEGDEEWDGNVGSDEIPY
jgi:hypothetical protein